MDLTKRVTTEMEQARSMYEGDLWINGKGLAVRKPTEADKLAEVKEGFATQNVIEEVVDRRRDGILGREPLWKLVPKSQGELTDAQEESIDEIVAAVVEWWNKREMLDVIKEMLVSASFDRLSEIRPYAPKTAYNNGSLKNVSTVAEALNLLHFEIKSPKNAGVFLEEDSLAPYSVYEFEKDGEKITEFSAVGADGRTHLTRIKEKDYSAFAEQNLPTIAKYIINKEASNEITQYEPMDLDGKLYLYELDLKKVFVTEPMKSLQKQISLDKTMQGRNTYTAGFRSKHWLNARPPQKDVKVVDSGEASGYRVEKINLPMQDGAGVQSFVQGSILYDEQGKVKGIATPNVVITDPVSVKTFLESADANRAGILAMADQLHVLMNDSATPSGFSRTQARDEFRRSLQNVKTPIDALGRWIIEFAVMFAANLTNRTEEFKQFRCDFNCIVDAGVLSPEEKKDNREAYEKGEISLETLRSRNNIEDTDAENVKVKSEPEYMIGLLTKIGDSFTKVSGIVSPQEQQRILAELMGWDEKKAAEHLAELGLSEKAEGAGA